MLFVVVSSFERTVTWELENLRRRKTRGSCRRTRIRRKIKGAAGGEKERGRGDEEEGCSSAWH
jgi:hypothetical protein